jgi:hypothetical protein
MSPHKLLTLAASVPPAIEEAHEEGADDVDLLAAEQRRREAGLDDEQPVRQWVMGRSAFLHRMPHHGGAGALWHEKWEQLVSV